MQRVTTGIGKAAFGSISTEMRSDSAEGGPIARLLSEAATPDFRGLGPCRRSFFARLLVGGYARGAKQKRGDRQCKDEFFMFPPFAKAKTPRWEHCVAAKSSS